MAEELNATPTVGGGRIYQRKEGGVWQFCLWVPGEGRIRKSLKTTDRRMALAEAERLTLDAKAAQAHGRRVISSTVAEAIAHYEELQMLRLTRGEIRSERNVRFRVGHLRKVLGAMFGLERQIGSLTQRDWDQFIPMRARQGVSLFTIQQEAIYIRGFCKFARHFGNTVVPELRVVVPRQQGKQRRRETFTADEYHELLEQLEQYVQPDSDDGLFVRQWGLNARSGALRAPRSVDQCLEKSRRELLRFYVLVAAASGCRPHELLGGRDGSCELRWKDVEFRTVEVMVSLSQRDPTPKTVAILNVRDQTKTGARSVPTAAGGYLKNMHEWSKFRSDDDPVFADQYGRRQGRAVDPAALRLHWQEVMRRWNFKRFDPDLYSLRHYFATRRLEAGAPPYLVAKTLGHSIHELTEVYSHVMMGSEGVIRSVWQDNTPEEFRDIGIVVADPSELR